MTDIETIPVTERDRAGKGVARALRREGRVPAVIYGEKEAPILISVDRKFLIKELERGGFTAKLFELALANGKQQVLARDVQFDPVSDVPIHVDFLRVAAGAELDILVAVHFVDEEECEGIRRGGVLNIVRHEVELHCPATSIPQSIEVSLAGFDIGDSIHISNVTLPEGVTPTLTDRDFTIATIAAPTVVAEEAAAEAEAEAAEEEEAELAEGEEAPETEGEAGEEQKEEDQD